MTRSPDFACHALARVAGDLVPTFIGSAYELLIVPAPPTEIARGATVDIRLAPLNSAEARDGSPGDYPIREAASGFAVWLELALREAIARLQTITQVLSDGIERAFVAGQLLAQGEHTALTRQLFEIKDAVEQVFVTLEDPAGLPPGSIGEGFELPPIGQRIPSYHDLDMTSDGWLSAATLRSRLYLIDEPEQRLHPALQRRAAAWLAELMQAWGSQCIVATHSAAFIDMPGEPRVSGLVNS